MPTFIERLLRPHPDELARDIWFQEEARAERQANLIRIIYMIVWLTFTVPGYLLPPPSGTTANVVIGGVWLLFGLGYHLYLMRHVYQPGLKYLSTSIDILMISANLFLYHFDMGYSTSLKAPPFMSFFLALSLSAFRFNRRLPLAGSALAISVYAAMFAYLLATQPVEFGTPLELFTTPKINLVYELYDVAYLATLALLLVILVGNVRRLVNLRVEEAEHALREQAQREQAQALLERYFTPEIARYLADNPPEMGGTLQPVTVLFSDLRGFTALSERIGPAGSVRLLNTIFDELAAIVFKYHGTLDKFLGDGMLVVFGTPSPQPDDAARAVRAACEMLNRVQQIGAEYDFDLHLGLAIHSGEVIFGNIGSPRRMELTVIGDAVNTTSRIEALNKEFGTSAILSETTYNQVHDGIKVQPLPATQLRGKTEELKLYALEGLA